MEAQRITDEMFFTVGKVMPAPACTVDGKCKECGCDEKTNHKSICAWSLMRSGQYWIPKRWFKQKINE